MPMKIIQLDPLTINQIAAGEVIENPSSVVKELVENGIDASAANVKITIKGGGRQLIRIEDDGVGMSQEDLPLAFTRHATSKITSIDDLFAVKTMGFRGEALPSIASVAKCSALSAEEGKKGTLLTMEGGKLLSCDPAERERGTTIEVRDLFYNVPARKKFLRSPRSDIQEIIKFVHSVSLGYPKIGFTLVSDGKKVLEVGENHSLEKRIEEILGREFLVGLLPFACDEITGYIGLPNFTRHNRSGQHLFINQRAVYSLPIAFAVKEGYGSALAADRHPVFILNYSADPSLVDVNVHPQKKEVRLSNTLKIKEALMRQVVQTIGGVPTPIYQSYVREEPQMEWMVRDTSYQPSPRPSPPVLLNFSFPEREKKERVIAIVSDFLLLEPEQGVLVLVDQKAAIRRIEADCKKSFKPVNHIIEGEALLEELNRCTLKERCPKGKSIRLKIHPDRLRECM